MPENDQNDHSTSDDGNMILNSGMPRNAVPRIELSQQHQPTVSHFHTLSSFSSTTIILLVKVNQ
jgi:hypothetical protein